MQSSTSSQIMTQQNTSLNQTGMVPETNPDFSAQRQAVFNFIKGELLKGEILDLRFDSLKLLLSSGQVLTASYDSNVPLSIGDQIFCKVESNDSSLLHLKLIDSTTTKSDLNPTIQKALSEASLPITEKNQQIVHTLINNQMSIDKNSILSLIRQSARIPDASIDSLVLMNKYQMPVTTVNAAQFEAYQNYEYRLNEQVNQLFSQIANLISDIKDPEQQISTINQITQVLGDDFIQHAEQNKVNEDLKPPITIENGQSSSHITDPAFHTTTNETPILDHTSLLKSLKEHFISHFTLPVNELNEPHRITHFYEKMEKDIEKLHSFFQEHADTLNASKSTEVASQLEQMKGNLDFMKTLNQVFTYVQIPIHLPSKNVHSELFVYTDKRKLRAGNALDVSVLLHLDMPSLGPVDFHLRLKEHFLTAKVCIEEEGAYHLVKEHLPDLQSKLLSEGYNMSYEIEHVKKLNRIIPNQLKQEETIASFRYSFDQRA